MDPWWTMLLLAHFLFAVVAAIDLYARYRRRPPTEWRIPRRLGLGPYPSYFIGGMMLALAVPVLGEVMWFLVRREIGRS
jgi:hypothetical protein